MENNVINILKDHIGDWLVTYNMWNSIDRIQRIDEIIPGKYKYLYINGPLIDFKSSDAEIRKYASYVEYSDKDLQNIIFYTSKEFESEIGKIMFKYIEID